MKEYSTLSPMAYIIPKTMQAMLAHKYGGPEVFQLSEVPTPIPKANEVLVKVLYSTVTYGGLVIRKGQYPGRWLFTLGIRAVFGISAPRNPIMGYEFSGIVVQVGADVKRYRVGDAVMGTTTGLKQGSYAEYVAIPEQWRTGAMVHKPEALDIAEAATLPIGGMTAYNLLTLHPIKPGMNALVYGASGSVGSYVAQLLKLWGCSVTAISSARHHGWLHDHGTDICRDYHEHDWYHSLGKFDFIFDAVGKLPSQAKAVLLKPYGGFQDIFKFQNETQEALESVAHLASDGHIKPHISARFMLKDLAVAHAMAEAGKAGNVVIQVGEYRQ